MSMVPPNRLIDRETTEDSLRTTIAILQAQQEATLDGILVVDREGKVLSFNRRFLEIWGIPELVAARGVDAELLSHAFAVVKDRDSFIAGVEYLYRNPTEIRTGDRINLIDGRVISRASVPVVLDDGEIPGRAWYFQDITEQQNAEILQSALFRISQLSRTVSSLDHLYESIRSILGELMDVTNFYIAVYDEDTGILSFPYFVDEFDPKPDPRPPGRELTAYVLRTGEPVLADPETFDLLVQQGEVDGIGAPSVDWLGVPLKQGKRMLGVIGVQSYRQDVRYSEREKQILTFVSQYVANAIEHRRKEDELREGENRYRQMFENNRAVKLLIEPDTGRIVEANVAACEFYGYSRQELLRKRITDINVLSAEEVRKEMVLAAEQKRACFYFCHRLASGETRDVEVHSGPIEVKGTKLLFSIIHDITERKQAERALRISEEKYRAIFNFASVGIYQSTLDGRFITANETLAAILGYDSVEELLQLRVEDVYFDPEQCDVLIAAHAPARRAADLELLWKKKNGQPIWIQLNAHLIDEPPGPAYFEGFVHDITGRKSAEEKLRIQSTAISVSLDGVVILDRAGRITYANESMIKLYGYSVIDDVLGRRWTEFYDDPEVERFMNHVRAGFLVSRQWRGEARGKRRDGSLFPQEVSLTLLENEGAVCVIRDITERAYAEEQIRHLAYHDALTSLPNRLLFKDRLMVALSHAQRDHSLLAVLFLDLDRFKVINDSLGHNVGDQLLQAVAARVHHCVRESDTVARLGGDEFTVLLPALSASEAAAKIAQKILETLRAPFIVDGREIFATTSIGIAIYPLDGTDTETLIKNSDTAMYQAKELGRDNYQLYNAEINARAVQRLVVENGLRRALQHEEFVVFYQPLVCLRSGNLRGVEALVRWQHPERGLLAPAEFISIAEASGLMVPIGTWVLRMACRQTRAWKDMGFDDLIVAVNLAVTQLQHPDLLDSVRSILEETGLEADTLELEITESSAMKSPESTIHTLDELKKLGVRISLDDFGTGHSSLSYLKRFPIDTLKIDQSFVRDIGHDSDTEAIVSAIVAMAHILDLKVIAEGVERFDQKRLLADYDCDLMQGYLISPPIAAPALEQLLRNGLRK